MVLTINSFISILQTINERGRQGESNIRILTQNTGSGEPRTDDSRQAAVMSEGHQSANGLPRPWPDAVQKLFVREGGCGARGWGDRQVGPGQLQWPVALLSPGLSGLIGARHDTLVIVHNKISPNLAKYICHENVTSLNTSRCKLSIVYWINIGPYFGFQSCSYYQYLMMLVTQNNRWHADYTGGRTNAVLKGDRGLFDDETLQIFANFHHFLMVSDQV